MNPTLKRTLIIFLAFMVTACSTTRVVNRPFEEVVKIVKEKYGRKPPPSKLIRDALDKAVGPDVIPREQKTLKKRVGGLGSVRHFNENDHEVTFLVLVPTHRLIKFGMKYSEVTIQKLGKAQTEINIRSIDPTRPLFGCCCFYIVDNGIRIPEAEAREMQTMVKILEE
jgi:hypothetical protein